MNTYIIIYHGGQTISEGDNIIEAIENCYKEYGQVDILSVTELPEGSMIV